MMGSGHPLEAPGCHNHTLGLPSTQKTAFLASQPGQAARGLHTYSCLMCSSSLCHPILAHSQPLPPGASHLLLTRLSQPTQQGPAHTPLLPQVLGEPYYQTLKAAAPFLGGLQSCFLSEFPTGLSCCHQLPSMFAFVESTVAALFPVPLPTEGCHMPCAKCFPHMILLVGDRSRTEPRTV